MADRDATEGSGRLAPRADAFRWCTGALTIRGVQSARPVLYRLRYRPGKLLGGFQGPGPDSCFATQGEGLGLRDGR